MVDKIPRGFRDAANKITSTFSWFDIVAGVGYQTFHGGDNGSSVAINHVLATQPFYSTKGSSSSFALNKVHTIDFDIPIEKPMTVKGTALVNIPMALCANGTALIAAEISSAIIRVRGGVEKVLSSSSEEVSGIGTAGTAFHLVLAVEQEIDDLLINDDILRLRIERLVPFEGNVKQVIIMHDPKGRTTTLPTPAPGSLGGLTFEAPTDLTMSLPIVIKDI